MRRTRRRHYEEDPEIECVIRGHPIIDPSGKFVLIGLVNKFPFGRKAARNQCLKVCKCGPAGCALPPKRVFARRIDVTLISSR